MTRGRTLILRTDGAARGNPGPAAAGVVIQRLDASPIARAGVYLGELTNNQAEYRALILGLSTVAQYHPAAVRVQMDSELVVRQMTGEYQVASATLLPLYHEAQTLARALPRVTFAHVPRVRNAEADALANAALDVHERSEQAAAREDRQARRPTAGGRDDA